MTGTRPATVATVVSTTASNSASVRYADSPVLPSGAIAWAPVLTSCSTTAASVSVSTLPPSAVNGVIG